MRPLLLLALLASPARADEPLVDAARTAPSLRFDLRYATANNFTHERLYPAARCLLRPEAAAALAAVARDLAPRKLGLLVFDCYRPPAVQRKMWSLVPDERYVADPAKGSRHSRGAAVDVTLVDGAGRPLPMGTDFDDFGPRAHRDAADLPREVLQNRATLDEAMRRRGFRGLPTEWWHFDLEGWEKWPILDVSLR